MADPDSDQDQVQSSQDAHDLPHARQLHESLRLRRLFLEGVLRFDRLPPSGIVESQPHYMRPPMACASGSGRLSRHGFSNSLTLGYRSPRS